MTAQEDPGQTLKDLIVDIIFPFISLAGSSPPVDDLAHLAFSLLYIVCNTFFLVAIIFSLYLTLQDITSLISHFQFDGANR